MKCVFINSKHMFSVTFETFTKDLFSVTFSVIYKKKVTDVYNNTGHSTVLLSV